MLSKKKLAREIENGNHFEESLKKAKRERREAELKEQGERERLVPSHSKKPLNRERLFTTKKLVNLKMLQKNQKK